MRILYSKSNWEMSERPLQSFLNRAKRDGFDAVEIFIPALKEPASEIGHRVRDTGLQLVAQINTTGNKPEDHLKSLYRHIELAMATSPLLINSHTGRDLFSFQENLKIFEQAIHLSEKIGIRIVHETHRSRPTYSAIDTARFLRELPDLKLTADFSHWFCVHESDLMDQPGNLEIAMKRSYHIHARVGFPEGPQVADPDCPEVSRYVNRSLELWKTILRLRQNEGLDYLTITPEFGPPPYMPCEPFSGRALADAWEVNCRFRRRLISLLSSDSESTTQF